MSTGGLMFQDARRYCPVCLQYVIPTRWGSIWAHRDSIGRDVCPASRHPYDLAVIGRRPRTEHAA